MLGFHLAKRCPVQAQSSGRLAPLTLCENPWPSISGKVHHWSFFLRGFQLCRWSNSWLSHHSNTLPLWDIVSIWSREPIQQIQEGSHKPPCHGWSWRLVALVFSLLLPRSAFSFSSWALCPSTQMSQVTTSFKHWHCVWVCSVLKYFYFFKERKLFHM